MEFLVCSLTLCQTLPSCSWRALLGVVAAWTLIVLGISIHFQTSFVDSATEREFQFVWSELISNHHHLSTVTYVSLAVFVSAVTLALFLVVCVSFSSPLDSPCAIANPSPSRPFAPPSPCAACRTTAQPPNPQG